MMTTARVDLVAALADSEVPIVQAALDELATLTIAASTRTRNAITTLLGIQAQAGEDEGEGDDDDDDGDDYEDDDGEDDDDDDDDDEADEGDDESGATIHAGGTLPPIDQALDQHLAQIAPPTLAHLFAALFHSCRDNFPAAARIAAEVARRGDAAAQLALVEAFITANAHHDTGHRTDDAVHDVVIDEVFPTLGAPALTRLLTWCTNGHLDDLYGDRMFSLFVPALAAASDADRTTLVNRLENFLREIIELQPERTDVLWSNLETLAGPAHEAVGALRDRLEVGRTEERARKKQRLRLAKALESHDPAIVAPAVLELRALSAIDLALLTGSLWPATRTPQLPKEARRALLAIWQRLDSDQGVARAIAGWAPALSLDELRADLDVLTGDAAARAALLRLAIIVGHARLPAATLGLLRTIATEYDHLPPEVAASLEVQALLYRAARRYDAALFARVMPLLAALPAYVPPDRTADHPTALASLVATLAESEQWELLAEFSRHLDKLGLTGKPLDRIVAVLNSRS